MTLTITLAVLCFLLTVLLVPRLWKRGVSKYVLQALALLLTLVLSLLAVAAVLNAHNHWYPSWDALLSDPQEQSLTSEVYGDRQLSFWSGESVQAQRHQASELQEQLLSTPELSSQLPGDKSRGVYLTVDVSGQKSVENHQVLLWLPPAYFTEKDRFFPVILAFTGFPGSIQSYEQELDIGGKIRERVAAGRMQETIVAVADVLAGNRDSECVDGSLGAEPPKTETYLIQDLLPWLKQNLRTINNRQAWATSGFSAGGWCASMITVRHPHFFGAALNQSGYFRPHYSSGQQWNDQQDARYLLDQRVAADLPEVNIYFYASRDDPLAMEDTETFSRQVRQPTSLLLETIAVGGHRSSVWTLGLGRGLDHLGRDLKFFAPLAAGT